MRSLPPMPRRQSPEAWESQRLRTIFQIEIRPPVSFPLQGEHGVGPCMHRAIDHPGKMNSQEGEGRIGHRVDQGIDQTGPGRDQFVILTAKGHDLRRDLDPGHSGHAIALEAGAVQQEPRLESSLGCLAHMAGVLTPQAQNRRSQHDPPAARLHQLGETGANLSVAHDARGRDRDPRHAAHVWFDFPHPVRIQPRNIERILPPALQELLQLW